MPRLPQPGSDNGTWGTILNEYLSQAHKADGTLKDDIITGATIAPNAITAATIQDGTVTEAKLHSDVQTKLNTGNSSITAADITDATVTGRTVLTATDSAAARTAIGAGTSNLTLGTTGATAAAGNDSRLTNERVPVNGSVTTEKIQNNAVTNDKLADDTVGIAELSATGTPSSAVFLRGDNTWAAPPSGYKNNILSYGADRTGMSDSTAAFQSAIAAGSVYVPQGTYLISAGALTGANIHIVGDGNMQTTINLTSGTYFIDDDQVWGTLYVAGIRFNGGAGIVRHRRTAANVTNMFQVVDCAFIGYTVCAIQSNSSDSPYWKVHRCYFDGGTASIGVALSGLTDGCSVTDCEFARNRVHIKMRDGGNNAYIANNDFLRFSVYAGTPRVDVWFVPKSVYVNSGTGMTLRSCKFGNENLHENDWRVLYADEAAGTYNGDRMPSMAASTGYITGHTIKDVAQVGLGDSNQIPMVYSTTALVAGCQFGPITQAGNTTPGPVFDSLTTLTYPNRNVILTPVGMGFAAQQPVVGMVGTDPSPLTLWTGTQNDYDNLGTPPANTVFVIVEE